MNRLRLPALALCLVFAGCEFPSGGGTDAGTASLFVDAGPSTDTTDINGFSWDPEVMTWYWGFFGGPDSPAPAYLSPLTPLFGLSEVSGVEVLIIDPTTGQPVASSPDTSAVDGGTWFVPGVPSSSPAPYLALGTGGAYTPHGETYGIPDPPPTNYLPTLTLRPIATTYSQCSAQQAVMVGDNGILQAVALKLGITVSALFDNYGGVFVWELYQPNPANPLDVTPADGVTVTASAGTVFNLDWAPPFDGDPMRSERGYIVVDDTKSPIGVSVVLVPYDVTDPVTFQPTDPITQAELDSGGSARLRPWEYFPVTIPSVPGTVEFAPVPLFGQDPAPSDAGTPIGAGGGGGGIAGGIPPWACFPF